MLETHFQIWKMGEFIDDIFQEILSLFFTIYICQNNFRSYSETMNAVWLAKESDQKNKNK